METRDKTEFVVEGFLSPSKRNREVQKDDLVLYLRRSGVLTILWGVVSARVYEHVGTPSRFPHRVIPLPSYDYRKTSGEITHVNYTLYGNPPTPPA